MNTHEQNELVEATALETLAIVEKTIRDSDTLKDVMIAELPPRVDNERLQNLTEISNFTLKEAVKKSKHKENITIASLESLWNYSEHEIYGHPSSTKYDGFHMRGKWGSKAYTEAIKEAVKASRFSRNTSTSSPTTYSPIYTSNRYEILSN